MEIVKTSSKGQLVIPENIRIKHNIKDGTRFILIEQGDKLILEREEKIDKILLKEKELEEKGWNALAEESLKEVWDNEKDDKVWKKYL
mgnify:CR=1 FL=1